METRVKLSDVARQTLTKVVQRRLFAVEQARQLRERTRAAEALAQEEAEHERLVTQLLLEQHHLPPDASVSLDETTGELVVVFAQ